MMPEEAWLRFRTRIEKVAWDAHEQDPTTSDDNRLVIPSWAMKAIFLETWRCAQSLEEAT